MPWNLIHRLRMHFYHFVYLNNLVSKYFFDPKIDFDGRIKSKKFEWNIFGAILINVTMLSVCLVYRFRIQWCHLNPYCILVNFSPPNNENYFALIHSIWSLIVLITISIKPKKYQNLTFLLPLNINKTNYDRFGLHKNQVAGFIRSRDVKLKLIDLIVLVGFLNGVFMATVIEIFRKSLITRYGIGWIIFWYLNFNYWVAHAGSNTNHIPIALSIIQDYLGLLQQRIEFRFNEIFKQLEQHSYRFSSIQNQIARIDYCQIKFEIIFQKFNDQMRPYLTIVIFTYTVLITFLIYILFLSGLPIDFVPIYAILTIYHVVYICILIIYASRISSRSNKFNHWIQILLMKNRKRKYWDVFKRRTRNSMQWRDELRISSISRHTLGFRLINGYLITSNTLIDISTVGS
ncbi:DNA-directed RNA polymerase I subunit RPA2-like [Sarcoptes scabiei]|nr:DNA-directed RNA polymerase I subunit RPA2-like [Sarcoptes scabiei]